MASIGTMIEQLNGMLDTVDLTEWENNFVASIVERYYVANKDACNFSSKQVESIERIWKKHFAQ